MDTQADEYSTWHDQRPTHRPTPDYVVAAQRRLDAANAEFDAHINSVLAGNGTPWEPRREELVQICVQAERELRECKRAWNIEQALSDDETDYQQTLHDARPGA